MQVETVGLMIARLVAFLGIMLSVSCMDHSIRRMMGYIYYLLYWLVDLH